MSCLSKENLKNYLNPILIETGTHTGDGVQVAKDSGFDKIISIEVSKIWCEKASQRFQSDDNISIIYGDSSVVLWSIIEFIKEKITFILDAHNLAYGEDTRKNDGEFEMWPLIKELGIIAKHPRNDHTIIIDDIHSFRQYFGTSLEQVKSILLKINSSYQFHLLEGIGPGGLTSDYVLVADIRKDI